LTERVLGLKSVSKLAWMFGIIPLQDHTPLCLTHTHGASQITAFAT